MNKICVIGLWHLGLVSAGCFAEMGHQVQAYDRDATLMANLKKGQLPLFEPGLDALIQAQKDAGRLAFFDSIRDAVKDASVVLITYDTPVNERDEAELLILDETITELRQHAERGTLIVINSQIPVGSCRRWQSFLDEVRPGHKLEIICSPENIRLGKAIQLFKEPDMVILGSNTPTARQRSEDFYKNFASPKFMVSWETAEMAKHALNAFFGTSISFANEIGNLCDALGADGITIAQILKQDSHIGKKAQVRPGLGFAGGTVARDIRALQNAGEIYHTPTILMDAVYRINEQQKQKIVDLVEKCFKQGLKNRRLAVYGLTYKPGTSTLRRSAPLEIIRNLHDRGAVIEAHDPKANLAEYLGPKIFKFHEDPYQAAENSEALIFLTEWPEFREFDFQKLRSRVKNALIVDAKNHLNGDKLREIGFHYLEIGRGQLTGASS